MNWIIFWTSVITVTTVLIAFICWFFSFKHTFIVRSITSTKDIVRVDKFKIKKQKGKAEVLKLRNLNCKAPIPPDAAIDYDKKGRYLVEAWRDENGVFTYIESRRNKGLGARDPITTDDKDFYAQEVADAHKYDSKDWKQNLPLYFSIGSFLVVALCLMIFWGDIMAPIERMFDKAASVTAQQAEITADLKEIILERQTVGGTPTPVEPPN
jgi:hypothetical protein